MSANDIAKFGVGYKTDSELHGTFVLSDEHVRFDKNGAGGAVPVQGYSGVWPLFGKPSERLGGADVIAVHEYGSSGSSSSSSTGKDGGGTQHDGSGSSSDGAGRTHFARRPKWMCRPKTTCSPCTKAERHRPYCQPYGNRVLIECRRIEISKGTERKPLPAGHSGTNSKDGRPVVGGAAADKVADAKQKEKQEAQQLPVKPPSAEPAGTRQQKTEPEINAQARAWERPVQSEPRSLQFGHVYLDERDERVDTLELWARQEMFVGGHVYKGYQICGRDRSKEAFDYAEFVAVNLVLALLGIFFLLRRQRVLAGQHQSMLARRIGRT